MEISLEELVTENRALKKEESQGRGSWLSGANGYGVLKLKILGGTICDRYITRSCSF